MALNRLVVVVKAVAQVSSNNLLLLWHSYNNDMCDAHVY